MSIFSYLILINGNRFYVWALIAQAADGVGTQLVAGGRGPIAWSRPPPTPPEDIVFTALHVICFSGRRGTYFSFWGVYLPGSRWCCIFYEFILMCLYLLHFDGCIVRGDKKPKRSFYKSSQEPYHRPLAFGCDARREQNFAKTKPQWRGNPQKVREEGHRECFSSVVILCNSNFIEGSGGVGSELVAQAGGPISRGSCEFRLVI